VRAPGCDGSRLPDDFVASSPEGVPDDDGAVALLGQPAHDPLRFGWDAEGDPLWDYTLHYCGWINHPRVPVSRAVATALDWIVEVQQGTGWEPYPTAIRLLHWLGLLARGSAQLSAAEHETMLASMAAQLEHLAANIEHHLDGNHLWTDHAALLACGLGLTGPLPRSLVDRFSSPFVALVDDQLASDGVHR
jgi:uncharacterized heparinase superfamily protein